MNRDQFAKTIKQKYPQYRNIDNETLTNAVITKYPQYSDRVREDNVATKFVKGLVEPAVNYGKYVGEAAYQANRFLTDKNYRDVITGKPISSEQWEELNRRPETLFYKGKDVEKIADVPQSVKTGIKAGAGGMSYVVPGSVGVKGLGTVGRMALGGALAGGLSGVAQGDDITAGNIARGAALGGVIGGGFGVAGKVLPKTNGRLGVLERAGDKVEQIGRDRGIASTRISTAGQNTFKKRTGQDIGEYISQNKLYGQNLDRLNDKIIRPLQEQFDNAISQADQNVPVEEVVNRFNKAIAELETPEGILDPTNRAIAQALKQERDLFIASNPSGIKLTSLVKARQSIDANTPKVDFVPGETGKMRELGSIYRGVMHDRAGNKELGRQLNRAYTFQGVLEKAPKGKNTLPFGLDAKTAAIAGGVVSNNPVVGAGIGIATNKVLNNPSTIGLESRALQKVGQAIKTPSTLARGAAKAIPTKAGVVTRNTVIQGGANTVNKPRKVFTKSKINYPTMDLGGY